MRYTQRNGLAIFLGIILIILGFIGISTHNYQQSTATYLEDVYYFEEEHNYEEGPQTELAYRGTEQLEADGINIPLLLQSDERWKDDFVNDTYGLTMEEYGSGVAAVEMYRRFWEDWYDYDYDYLEPYTYSYRELFNRNFDFQWKYFKQMTEEFGYPLTSFGNNFDKAKQSLESREPVIVSFKPGTFSEKEHFAVLALDNDGHLRLLDPLDTPEKSHYKIHYDETDLTDQIKNYWAAAY